jgi:hypothetical protein
MHTSSAGLLFIEGRSFSSRKGRHVVHKQNDRPDVMNVRVLSRMCSQAEAMERLSKRYSMK